MLRENLRIIRLRCECWDREIGRVVRLSKMRSFVRLIIILQTEQILLPISGTESNDVFHHFEISRRNSTVTDISRSLSFSTVSDCGAFRVSHCKQGRRSMFAFLRDRRLNIGQSLLQTRVVKRV